MRLTKPTAHVFGALAVLAVTVGLLPAMGTAATEAPKATEIGVDAKTIHIATVADVDNRSRPGCSRAASTACTGAVKYINANGGIGGRKLVLDFYDSKLNPNQASNNIITACENDSRWSGNGMFLLSSFDDAINCSDKAGPSHRTPRHPAVARARRRRVHRSRSGSRARRSTAHPELGPADLHRPGRRLEVLREEVRTQAQGTAGLQQRLGGDRAHHPGLGLLAQKGGIDITEPSRQPSSATRRARTRRSSSR